MSRNKDLIKIKKPKNINTIFGLPAKSYTDQEFWEKECNTVLADGWLFVGFVHEFKKIGDVVPLFIAGKPIGEPIARGGPFVMNTKAEILEAIRDYNNGTFAKY